MLSNNTCENITHIHMPENLLNLVVSAFMFLAGVVGNLLALAILGLRQKDRRAKSSVFCILVTGLAVTDLAGTCLLSPPVFVCYSRGMSLVGLTGDTRLCTLFAFALTFFGLASMLILCAMAVERCLAISHPYFYSKHVRRSFAKTALGLIYLFTGAFCLLPLLGFGRHKQYCPGTWCFIKMEAEGEGAEEEWRTLSFSLSYSLLVALLITVVFLCNGSVIVSLCRMHRSQITRRGSVVSASRKRGLSSWFGQGEEEVEHLVLLASMTVIFVICSLPLTIFGFVNAISPVGNDQQNLLAFRFNALNPVMDPWVFIIFRKSVFQQVRALSHCCMRTAAVKATPPRGVAFALESTGPADSVALQSKSYSILPQ
ncbi:prostacyclin receptor [Electrophorus electricus]|uniref:Thromboxane A2 receptor n=1 Tax=Electrophorus electricus TaxID=8005 RepID=A0A4W4H4U8_ELEEL|nr:prostacyclin receptor [Electrophorus electricus]